MICIGLVSYASGSPGVQPMDCKCGCKEFCAFWNRYFARLYMVSFIVFTSKDWRIVLLRTNHSEFVMVHCVLYSFKFGPVRVRNLGLT